MNWVPITRKSPRVVGVNPKYASLLDVEIDVSDTPPDEWAQAFIQPSGVPISMSMHPPQLEGSTITLMPPDDQVEAYVAHVDVRIAHANERYERVGLPAREREQAAEVQEQKRLDDARRRAKKL
jgi:hypothetical protein